MSPPDSALSSYDALLRANLERVFSERSEAKRKEAIAEIFVEDPVMYEPTAVVTGRDAIAGVAGNLLERFGPDFRFHAAGPTVGHHELAVLRWHTGAAGITGADAAEIRDGRIARLWVLLDDVSEGGPTS